MEKFGKFQMFTPFLNEISSFSSVGEAVDGGHFLSDPYPADDWAGSTKRRMYVDMVCMN